MPSERRYDPCNELRGHPGRNVAAYRRVPPTEEEVELALLAATALDDDSDWEALYAEGL